MTVGERIQYHRKKQNLSQEELGQKLLVSRQTVSLWETDQTLPTVDNLRLLRDIFGISIDELLGVEPASVPDEPTPLESYTFRHTREPLDARLKSQRRSLLARFGAFLLVIAMFFMSASQTDEYLVICLCLGAFAAVCACRYIAVFWQLRKKHDSDLNRMLANTYTYNLFENELHIRIQRDGECLENLHIPYDALAKVGRTECYYEIYNSGRMYFVPRSLFETGDPALRSRFEALLETKLGASKGVATEGKWKVISIALVVASIAVLVVGAGKLGLMSLYEFTRMGQGFWAFSAFLLIPFASIAMGIYLQRKGKRALKNIVIGIIVIVLLVMQGISTHTWGINEKEALEEYFLSVETCFDMDFPGMEQFFSYSSSINNGPEIPVNLVKFDPDSCAEFESQLSQDSRWLEELPAELVIYSGGAIGKNAETDYILLYNATTGAFNSIPKEPGMYRFLFVCYEIDTHCMRISDYTLTC